METENTLQRQLRVFSNADSSGANTIEGSLLEITVAQLQLPASFKDHLRLMFEFRNAGEVTIPAESTLRIYDKSRQYRDKFYTIKSELKPRSRDVEKVELVMSRKVAASNIDDLPSCLYMEMFAPHTEERVKLENNLIPIEIHNMWKDLLQWRFPAGATAEIANILVFGWKGSGVSTLINRMLQLVVEGDEKVRAALKSDQHVTTTVDEAGFHQNILHGEEEDVLWMEQMQKIKARFVDTPGMGTNARAWAKKGDLDTLLSGQLRRNWELGQKVKPGRMDPSKEIHAVIFVIPAAAFFNSERQVAVADYMKHLISLKRRPVIVISHIDETPKISQLIESIRAFTGNNEIFLVDNSLPKSFETSKQYYKILRSALGRATEYMGHRNNKK